MRDLQQEIGRFVLCRHPHHSEAVGNFVHNQFEVAALLYAKRSFSYLFTIRRKPHDVGVVVFDCLPGDEAVIGDDFAAGLYTGANIKF